MRHRVGCWCHPSQKIPVRMEPMHSPWLKWILAWTDMLKQLHSREQRWRFQKATVICILDIVSAFNKVVKDFQLRIVAADRMHPNSWGSSRHTSHPSGWQSVGVVQCPLRFIPAFDKNVHLTFPPQLYNRLDSWSNSTKLLRDSVWSKCRCIRPPLCWQHRDPEQQLQRDARPV